MKIPDSIKTFAHEIAKMGATTYLTGGWVRDYLRGEKESHDYDLEIYSFPQLGEYLKANYVVNLVGESFTIYKVEMLDDDGKKIVVDVSLPRLERLAEGKKGHKAFEVRGDAFLDPKEGCRRRDFTVNSLLFNVLTGEALDFYGGQEDIKNKVIRVVDPETFIEDSLRVLRAMQFAARFNFTVHPDTVKLCRSIDLSDLPAERLWGEIEKWLLSANPSVGLKYFFELGIYKLFPISDEFHVNLDLRDRVAESIGKAMDVFVDLHKECTHENGYKQAVFICLLSNLFWNVADLEKFLDILKVYTIDGYNLRKKVLGIASNPNIPQTDTEIRRESTKKDLGLFVDFKVAEKIAMGLSYHNLNLVTAKAIRLKCINYPLKPLLMGQHLIDLGLPQGKRIGEICKAVFERQLDGKVNTVEEAIAEAKKYI